MPAALHLERETSVRPSSGFGAVGRTETTSGVKLGRPTVRGRPPLIDRSVIESLGEGQTTRESSQTRMAIA
ncbi:hypothetical protein Isop_1333 [Isosphaera pallida ATCC 43644]|uniref:Uncharacterized protein n=1 Tax=Isosphaera pallida (strain ATCC 43644 / DSM 9630 / IS1B) TaxID=575540 RepID=E8QWM7_ISOPI|nr:hypothetical protein Isop_1333 [Isosphaera pallida ATCC 43644]